MFRPPVQPWSIDGGPTNDTPPRPGLIEALLALLQQRGALSPGYPRGGFFPAATPDLGGGPMLGSPDVRPPVPAPRTPVHEWLPDAAGGPANPMTPWANAGIPRQRPESPGRFQNILAALLSQQRG